jgi:hypothetical protein
MIVATEVLMVSEDIASRVKSYIQHQATKSREFVVDLVATSQGRYIDIVGNVSDDVAARKPAPDEWSIRELTLHVLTTQASVARMVADTARGNEPAPEKRGLGMTRSDDPAAPFASIVEELRGVNADMLDAIRAMPEPPNTSITPPHPFFGPLNCVEWAVFQRVHDEDHVQHANKILAAVAT